MGSLTRWLVIAILVAIGCVLYREAGIQSHTDVPDPSKVGVIFAGMILDGLGLALIIAFMIVPAIGSRVGDYFFSPSEKIEATPHSIAVSKLAQGDPEGAVQAYQDVLAKEPGDTHAISEIVRICCRDLGDTARASAVVEQALEREWTHEQALFLANRLADVYLLQDDPARARQLLTDVAQWMEGTKYALMAQRRLQEIDRSMLGGVRAPLSIPGSHVPEPPAAG